MHNWKYSTEVLYSGVITALVQTTAAFWGCEQSGLEIVTFMGLICLKSQLRYISYVFVVLALVMVDTSYISS